MSSTTTRDVRMLEPEPGASGPHLVPPPKLRRRPAVVAGAVAAICLGALLAVWAWSSTTHTQEVLAARTTIPRGAVIGASDLERVRISGDPALSPLPASAFDSVVGKRAALDIAAGGLLTAAETTSTALPPKGMSVVGVALTPAQVPGLRLESGDKVRIVLTPAQGADAPSGAPPFSQAQVVDVHADATSGDYVVDVLVPYADASVLAARAATGDVALVLDSNAP